MKQLEEMTLQELQKINNIHDLEEYFMILKEIQDNRISKKIVENLYGKPIETIYREVRKEEEKMRSHSFFPGDLVLVHPNIKEQKSKNFKTCDFSGAIISPGTLYVSYRPLLENLTTKESFVLKRTIHVEIGYIYNLPTAIDELESLEQNMILETPDQEINFNHLNNQMGGSLLLQKLKKERRRLTIKSQ